MDEVRNTAGALQDVIMQCPQCGKLHTMQRITLAGHWKSNALTCDGCGRIYDLVCRFALVGR